MQKEDILAMSVDLAKTHLSNSPMDPSEIPALIQDIHKTLIALYSGEQSVVSGQPATPAAESDPKVAPIINDDISAPAFEGLEEWLAKRLPERIARKLNRSSDGHPSVFEDYLICLEDGCEVKLLRPHVEKRFGISFIDYMNKWNLPGDYPSAPPSYLKLKRELAKKAGLGSSVRGPRGKAKTGLKTNA